MCDSIKDVVRDTNAQSTAIQHTCTNNSACDGIICNFPTILYVAGMTFLPCHDPPAIEIVIFDSNGQVVYQELFDHSRSSHVNAGIDINVNIVHHNYSMDVEVRDNGVASMAAS